MVCIVGCKESTGDPITRTNPVDETPMTKADSVIANCYLVRDAAEAFAAENNGIYPYDTTAHKLPDGRTLIDFLPNGEYLVNPYTGARTEPWPMLGMIAGSTGISGVRSVSPYGYLIVGVDDELTELVRIERRPWDE